MDVPSLQPRRKKLFNLRALKALLFYAIQLMRKFDSPLDRLPVLCPKELSDPVLPWAEIRFLEVLQGSPNEKNHKRN